MAETNFSRLEQQILNGGEVHLHRGSVFVDITFKPGDNSDVKEPINPSSQAFSSALQTCESQLRGDSGFKEQNTIIDARVMDENGIRPIDQLPINAGSDLNLHTNSDGQLELSVLGWGGEARAKFVGDSIEEVLENADKAVSDPTQYSKM